MKDKKSNNTFFIRLKKKMYLLIALSPLLYLFFSTAKWPIYNSLLDNYSVVSVATIIYEKNILGKGVINQMYTYSYRFAVKGKLYTGNSKVRGCKVGNKIEIEYLYYFPSINRTKKKPDGSEMTK